MIIESIKQGFSLTNKNWQVILIEAVVAVISFAGLVFIIAVSAAAAVAMLGDDIANIQAKLPELLGDPVNFISKYIRLALIIFALFSVYLTVVSVLMLYIFGGKLGVLKNAVCDAQHKFKLSSFFKEGKRMFFPLLWLFSIMLAVFLFLVILMFVGFIIYIQYSYNASGTASSVFILSFVSLLLIFIGTIGIFGSLIFTVYTAVAIAAEKAGVFSSFKKAFNFMKNKPMSILFCIIIFASIIASWIVLSVLGKLLAMIPVVGLVISILYQLLSYAVLIYLDIVMCGSLIFYYLKSPGFPAYTHTAMHI